MVYRDKTPEMIGAKLNIEIPDDINLEDDPAQFEIPEFAHAINNGRTVESITLNSPSTGTLAYDKAKILSNNVTVYTYVNRSFIENNSYPVNLTIKLDRQTNKSEVLSVSTIKRYGERKARGDFDK